MKHPLITSLALLVAATGFAPFTCAREDDPYAQRALRLFEQREQERQRQLQQYYDQMYSRPGRFTPWDLERQYWENRRWLDRPDAGRHWEGYYPWGYPGPWYRPFGYR